MFLQHPLRLFRSLALSFAALGLAFLPFASTQARADELTAEQILEEALNKGFVGFKKGTAIMQMQIVNKRGEVKSRTLEVKAMVNDDGQIRSLLRFQKPAEVAGISFLVRAKKDQLPDQYVYVPAAKVVRRVAAGNATSSFFGTDFTFADLMPLPANQKDNVKLKRLPDTEVGGQKVYVVETIPTVEGSPYGKVIAYVHQKSMVPLKIEFFDPSLKALKTLRVKKLKKMKDGQMLPVKVQMKNEQKGSKTILEIMNPNPRARLTDADFTEEAMQR
ncbi:MAG: outer membrane lipoprotein-sorting protein [Deltaproteobacteria bacterium]|nr:outer membrane lipoprotein-sorting protein [Deltaproteobacteria bacterium]